MKLTLAQTREPIPATCARCGSVEAVILPDPAPRGTFYCKPCFEAHLTAILPTVAEYVDANDGKTKTTRIVPRCPDCGSMHCAKGGGLESLIPCVPEPEQARRRRLLIQWNAFVNGRETTESELRALDGDR